MKITFKYNLAKAIQVLAFLLRAGPVDKVKLMKLVYLADRHHYISYGVPITGDRQQAMPYGPVPSATLDAINGSAFGSGNVFRHIHVDDHLVSLRQDPGQELLSDLERQTLNHIIVEHGAKGSWKLVRETHRLPEYAESYVEGTSKNIPYERISKHSQNPGRFRLNRPVVSPEAAALMHCPFPKDDDL